MKIYFTSREKARKFVSNAINKSTKKVFDNGVNAAKRWSVIIVK